MSSESVQFEALRKTSTEQQGTLKIVSGYKKGGLLLTYAPGAEKVEEPLPIGEVTQGRFEGVQIQIHPKTKKQTKEYRIREADGTLVIVKGSMGLNDEETGLAAVTDGELVMLQFNGMKTTKSGNDFADFTVLRAVNASN